MANVNIKFNGKEYLLSCEDGQEEHLEQLSLELNKKFELLKDDLGNLGENKLLLITAIKIMDEFFDIKKKNLDKKKEFENLSEKFKELKSLVYEYRDKKESEISKMIAEQDTLKENIVTNKENYEQFIDSTTNEIENFLNQFNKDSKVQ